MSLLKIVSRYGIISIIILFIHYFELNFFNIILFQSIIYLSVCSYLEFYAPKHNSIIYYENSGKENTITQSIIINILINYCSYILFLFITINNIKLLELNLYNIIIN